MNIDKSYRIWTSPRTGHTLLAKVLELTGKAGVPGEHINLHEDKSFVLKYGVNSFDGIKKAIWKSGSGGSPIFVCKLMAMHNQ